MSFEENSAVLKGESMGQLMGITQWLNINSDKKISIKVNASNSENKKVKLDPALVDHHPNKGDLPKKLSLEQARVYSIESILADLVADTKRISISSGRTEDGRSLISISK